MCEIPLNPGRNCARLVARAGRGRSLIRSVRDTSSHSSRDAKIYQCRVLRDVIPPTPPGPEGSNGNGLVRAQWVTRYFFGVLGVLGVWNKAKRIFTVVRGIPGRPDSTVMNCRV